MLLHQLGLLLGYFSFWPVGNGSRFGFGALGVGNFCKFYEVLRMYVLFILTILFKKIFAGSSFGQRQIHSCF